MGGIFGSSSKHVSSYTWNYRLFAFGCFARRLCLVGEWRGMPRERNKYRRSKRRSAGANAARCPGCRCASRSRRCQWLIWRIGSRRRLAPQPKRRRSHALRIVARRNDARQRLHRQRRPCLDRSDRKCAKDARFRRILCDCRRRFTAQNGGNAGTDQSHRRRQRCRRPWRQSSVHRR